MGFNVNSFKANGLIYGGARPTQFQVEMLFPRATRLTEKASFMIKATQIPASIIEPIDVGYFGRKIKLAGDRIYQDWTVTVMNDEDFLIRSAFEEWHNSINTIISNRLDAGVSSVVPAGVLGAGITNSYKTTAVIKQFGKVGPGDESGVVRAYQCEGLFPTSIDAIPLDWDATNQYEQFDVTFSFDWCIPLQGFGPGAEAIPLNPELNPA